MIIKIVILGLCVCIISFFLKQNQSAFIIIINMIFAASVFLLIFDDTADSLRNIINLLEFSASGSKILMSLYKAAAVCVITKIASDICKESGNTAVSDVIELGGRIMLMVISLPFLESVIKTAAAFVK